VPALYDGARLVEHRQRGVVLEGYSPFTSTDLGDPVLAEVAAEHGVSPAQVVLRWHLEHGVVVIPRSATRERIAANLDVFGFAVTEEERAWIDRLSTSRMALDDGQGGEQPGDDRQGDSGPGADWADQGQDEQGPTMAPGLAMARSNP
jgi:diketogulonate reductase-like aldo/keto reductase